MDQQDDKLANRVAQIYKEMEPALLGLAHRFRAPNPQVTVNEWMSRAYEIVRKLENGELQLKVYKDPENQGEMTNYNPEIHDRESLIAPVKNYLKQAFIHDILKGYNMRKRRREAQAQEPLVANITSQYSQTSFAKLNKGLFKYDAITIDSLVNIIQKDWEQKKKVSHGLMDTVSERFILSVLNFCNSVIERGGDWAKLIVVCDVDETDNKKFFTYDFRSDLEEGVRQELCKMVVQESNPAIARRLWGLASPDNKQALGKRLFRYLYEYKRGFPERLRIRVKNKDL